MTSTPPPPPPPEQTLDELCAMLGMTPDALMQRVGDMKMMNATGDMFQCILPMRTPCLPRTDAWFARHKAHIIERADTAYAKHDPELPSIDAFTSAIKTVLFDKMVHAYKAAVPTRALTVQVTQSCCDQHDTCSFSQYQRLLFVGLRERMHSGEQ